MTADAEARRRWHLFACLTILGLALTANIEGAAERAFATTDDLTPVDFPVFYLGGKVALQRGATPLYYPPRDRTEGYTLLFQNADPATPWAQMGKANGFNPVLQFTNPPFSAVLMAPFALLPWQVAYILWEIGILACAAGAIYLALSLLPSPPRFTTFVAVFAAACFFFPLRNTLVFGQANATILFLWTLGVYLLKRQRPMSSGLCFALGTVIKVSPAVALPFLVLRRQWKWLGAYVAGVAGFTAVSIWDLGWQTNRTWLTAIYPSIAAGLGNVENRSLAGLLDVITGPRYFANLVTAIEWPVPSGLADFEKICGAVIILTYVLWCWREQKSSEGLVDELVLLPLVYLLAAPFSWPHHFTLALLPLVYIWGKGYEATSRELVALYVSSMILGTELPIYLTAYTSAGSPALIIPAIALWPAATCAIIWAGTRIYSRSTALAALQPDSR